MKYYHLTTNIDKKETGCFPQVESFKVYGSIRDFGKNGKILDKITLPEPKLFAKAKTSTFLSFVLNSKTFITCKSYFVDFLSMFDIGEYQTWKIKVHHRKKVLNDYSVFHQSFPKQNQYVDYTKSQFYIQKIRDREHRGRTIHVKDRDNYLNTYQVLYDDGYWLKCDELVFNFSSATEDLFRLTDIPFGHGYYVSERLKEAIEKERFTGMAFKEIEEYNKKIKVIY